VEYWPKTPAAAVLAKAGDQIRFYRKGAGPPAIGKTRLQLIFRLRALKGEAYPRGSGVSGSNDLAYNVPGD